MNYPFYQVDVFTNTPFTGNPLAVFFDVEELSSQTMQAIAQEMNLSETIFVLPPGDLPVDFSVRIFTPEKEIPFAGHPTIGTAHILRETGKVSSGNHSIKLSMKAGIITVTQGLIDNILFMDQPLPEYLSVLDCAEKIGQVLSIPISTIKLSHYPIQIVSTGLPALLVPINSIKSLEKIVPNLSELNSFLHSLGVEMLYAFTDETINPSANIHARMFAPPLGILEDPATGSAAGAMGAYIFKHKMVSDNNNLKNIIIEQGYKMGRPSCIHIEIYHEYNEIKKIKVGGESVTVIEGFIKI
jgi:trans-2,3-dihydro-3-hydroxyanthranilate isomerase